MNTQTISGYGSETNDLQLAMSLRHKRRAMSQRSVSKASVVVGIIFFVMAFAVAAWVLI